jgi:hypothetical protein
MSVSPLQVFRVTSFYSLKTLFPHSPIMEIHFRKLCLEWNSSIPVAVTHDIMYYNKDNRINFAKIRYYCVFFVPNFQPIRREIE